MQVVYTKDQIKDILTPVFRSYGIRKAVLFGSYGKGTATTQSDVDLMVDSGLRGLSFMGFLYDIQEALGKEVDLLDITHIIPGSVVDTEIQRTGVPLFEK